MPASNVFTGETLAYPMRLDSKGKFAVARSRAEIYQSKIVMALATQAGERVMRPTFGGDLDKGYFLTNENIDAAIGEKIADVFEDQFPELLPRNVTYRRPSENVLYVDVYWSFRTPDPDSQSERPTGPGSYFVASFNASAIQSFLENS